MPLQPTSGAGASRWIEATMSAARGWAATFGGPETSHRLTITRSSGAAC